jgi:hypothetical protein
MQVLSGFSTKYVCEDEYSIFQVSTEKFVIKYAMIKKIHAKHTT